MTSRETIALVARRELREGVRSRTWRASLAIQVVLVAGLALVSILTGGDSGPSKREVAVAGPRAAKIAVEARRQQRTFGIELEVERVGNPAAGRRALADEDVDAALGPRGLLTGEDPDASLLALLDSAYRLSVGEAALRRAGLSSARIEAALEPPPLAGREIETGEGSSGRGLAFLGALLLYIAIITFGYGIASSVIAEKSSRVIEVVLSAIRPHQLLAGKVVGVGLLGLLQLAAIALVGLAVALPSGQVDLPASTPQTVLLVFVYFILGYAFYGCAFSGAAALVSRQEDSQSTTAPILVVLIGSYLAGNAALGDPGGGLATVGALLPPMAPMVVPGLVAQGALPAWELAASPAIMLVSILLVVRVAGRVYSRSVLRFGTPMTLRGALGRGARG